MCGAAIGQIIGAGLSYFGGRQQQQQQQRQWEQQMDWQRTAATTGIQMRVEDARAAGIHPLAALGAQTFNPSPISAGTSNAMADHGQDIGKAITAALSVQEKEDEFKKEIQKAQLTRLNLENQDLASKIATRTQTKTPSMPSPATRYLVDGQGETATTSRAMSTAPPGTIIQEKPLERVYSAPGVPSQEVGAIPDVGYARTKTGWAPVFSKDVQERLEDDHVGGLMWSARNRIYPSFGFNQNPPSIPLKEGEVWAYNPVRQEYYITKPYKPPKAYMTGRK